MENRRRDTEESPEILTESREGQNSPMNPDAGPTDGQTPSAYGGNGEGEGQDPAVNSGNGEKEEQDPTTGCRNGEREGEGEGEGQDLPGDPEDETGKSSTGKGDGNLFLRLLNSEGMRYLFIGGCTTMVNLVVYAVLCRVVRLNVNVSNIISVSVSILFAYITNKLIVFRSHCGSFSELAAECARFIGARLATMAIEVGGVFVLYEILHQNEMVAKLATQVLVVIGNYFISRFLVFKDRNT